MTPAEKLLWSHLRNRQVAGFKFRRQHPIGRLIVDFCCPAYGLVVEVDGSIHRAQREYDAARTEELEHRGYRVVRFSNRQVLQDIEGVVTAIENACRENTEYLPHPTPCPLPSPIIILTGVASRSEYGRGEGVAAMLPGER